MNYTERKVFNQALKIYRIFNKGLGQNQRRYNQSILDGQKGNDYIKTRILEGKPFMCCRLGSTELMTMVNYLGVKNFRKNGYKGIFKNLALEQFPYWKDEVLENICTFSGFFPKDPELIEKFAAYHLECIRSADLMGVWYNYYEDSICNTYCPQAVLTELKAIEPYYHTMPWSAALEGKKVLMIHPYAKSISGNYKYRTQLFKDNVLPAFDLKVFLSVQSIANSPTKYSNWFEALESMQTEISCIDFDVAIIGAGAYGLPLAHFVKQMGRQAIHLGGATQILFGIKGKRWDNIPEVSALYNAQWINPLPEETPQNFMKIENGCYW